MTTERFSAEKFRRMAEYFQGPHCAEMRQALRQAADDQERLEAADVDAERYRWHRGHSRLVTIDAEPYLEIWSENFNVFERESEKLDKLIDVARNTTREG